MIKTAEALRTARGLLGTSYDELDCINLIKKVIRVSAGGEKSYTTAGTNALWESDKNSAKYRDLTWKQEGISGAKAGMLAFMGVGTGDVNHVGLVTEKGTVVHSSKSRGGTVETELTEKNGWNGLGKHRMIEVNEMEKEFGNATVSVTSGYLNIREGAGTAAKIIAKAENGTRVNVIREAGGTGWKTAWRGTCQGRICWRTRTHRMPMRGTLRTRVARKPLPCAGATVCTSRWRENGKSRRTNQ